MLRNGIKFQTSFNNALAQHLRFSFVHIRAVCCSACKKDDVNRIENNLIEHDIRDSIVRFYSTDEISFNFDKTYYFVSLSGQTSERVNERTAVPSTIEAFDLKLAKRTRCNMNEITFTSSTENMKNERKI